MIPTFDYLRQYARIRPDIDRAIERVLHSGQLVLGKEVAAFEELFASSCRCRNGVGVNSGTDALHLALRAAGAKEGDEVLTVPNTAVATVSAICATGARPVFVDIDEHSFLVDVNKIEAALTARTKAIIPVHLYGQMADMHPIMEIARRHGLAVIEDCAQAHGAMYADQPAGSIGDIGCYSFYPTKNLGAYGDGGMCVTGDVTLAEKIRMLREYGFGVRNASQFNGFNTRLDELQAAVLRAKFPYLGEWNAQRRTHATTYARLLGDLPIELPREEPGRLHVYHLYVIRSRRRNGLRSALLAAGVRTGVHYPTPIHLQPAYSSFAGGEGSFPVAERVQREILSLPFFPEITDEEMETVSEAIRSFYAGPGADGKNKN